MKRLLLALAVVIVLTGCRVESPTPVPVEQPRPTATLEREPTPAPSATPTAVPPFNFVFPTPVPAAVSIWRPPLYDTPWALGPFDHFYFSRPIAADEVNWPLPDYRYGDHFSDSAVIHTGVDIAARPGTPVLATGSGEVVWAGYGLFKGWYDPDDPYGLAVAVRHDFGFQGQRLYTVYAHMERVDVRVGQAVEEGEVIGRVGSTGKTTGPHLHYEVRLGENSFYHSRNPELWLAPPAGWGVLAGRVLQEEGRHLPSLEVIVRSIDTGQVWKGHTYEPVNVNSDDYYQENYVLSDLPQGRYVISSRINWVTYEHELEVFPGRISYFTLQKRVGFSEDMPQLPADPRLPEEQPLS